MSVMIHGKEYITCAERLDLAHKSGKGFQVLESRPLQVGDRWLWRCMITVDNQQFIGTAEVKLANARKGSPDDSNPFECGETSALARALGIAGFGAPDTVCSADEIVRSQPTTPAPAPAKPAPKPASNGLLLGKLKARAIETGWITGETTEQRLASWHEKISTIFGSMPEDAELSKNESLALINFHIEKHETEKKGIAVGEPGLK